MAEDKERRGAHKQSKADNDRKDILVGEAGLRRVKRGGWDEADIRGMMDKALVRPVDRSLLSLG